MTKKGKIKSKEDIVLLRESGKRLARVLRAVEKRVKVGVTPRELDALAEKLIREGGDVPAFKDYTPHDADRPYPATLCVSTNDEVVHGIPNNTPFKEGDIVCLDIGLAHKGFITDMAVTVPVGNTDQRAEKLMNATKRALNAGIKAARAGNTLGDIGYAIEDEVKKAGFTIVDILGGHGVGYAVHEPPFIPNYGTKGMGETLKENMVIALEPIVSEGTGDVYVGDDGYTYYTQDGSRSAHFEHTLLVTKKGGEVLTQ